MTLQERVRAVNERTDGLVRKFLLIFITLAVFYIIAALFPYCMPFVFALIVAMLMEPLVKPLRRLFAKVPGGKALATILAMAVFYGVALLLVFLLSRGIIRDLVSLAGDMPDIIRSIRNEGQQLIDGLQKSLADILPEGFGTLFSTSLNELIRTLTSFATTITGSVAGGAIAAAISLPMFIFGVMLTVMGTFWFSYDKERIFAFFKRIFPLSVVSNAAALKRGVILSLLGQLKTQATLAFILTFLFISGLFILRVDFWLLFGLLLGVTELLPVIGSGLFLAPWGIIAFINGDTFVGAGLLSIFLAVTLIRNTVEPRLMSRRMGIYPLAAMISMYAGYKIMGLLGIIAGPIILSVLKVVLLIDSGDPLQPEKPVKRAKRGRWLRRKKGDDKEI